MSAIFFAPGIAVMRRMGNQKKLPFLCAAHLLPCAVLYYMVGNALSPDQTVVIAALAALAVYAMGSFTFRPTAAGWSSSR